MNLNEMARYNEWKNCITISCGLDLTKEYVETRLAELRDETNAKTQEFKKKYGEGYTNMVIGHFLQAQSELA